MLEAGIKGRQEVMVTDENSAAAVGSGLLPVFATPAMVALMAIITVKHMTSNRLTATEIL